MQLMLDILVLFVLLTITLRGLLRVHRERRVSSADLICAMIFIFYGLPLAYDRVFSSIPPDWFYPSSIDPQVKMVYSTVLLTSVILIKLGAYSRSPIQRSSAWEQGFNLAPMQPNGTVRLLTLLAWLLMLLPVPAVFLTGTSELFFSYAAVVQSRLTVASPIWIPIVQMTCILAVMGFFLIYWVSMRRMRTGLDPARLLALFLAIVAVYIYGKRSLVFALLIIISCVKFLEGRLRVSTFLAFGVLLVLGSYVYIGYAKGYERSPMEFVRGDLARDYTLRHVIYQSGWTASNVVPYRGATYVFVATAYVPRIYWPAKPWPAPVYLTNNVFGQAEHKRLGWGFGLGFMEELIMNFGYVGLLACLPLGRVCVWFDRFIYQRSSYFAILWVPLIFGCVFASSVILKLVVFVVVPTLLLSPIVASPRAWSFASPDIPEQFSAREGVS